MKGGEGGLFEADRCSGDLAKPIPWLSSSSCRPVVDFQQAAWKS